MMFIKGMFQSGNVPVFGFFMFHGAGNDVGHILDEIPRENYPCPFLQSFTTIIGFKAEL